MAEKHLKHKVCSNCGYEFKDADNYCPNCGQKNHELKIPLKHLLEEVAENTLHLDSKTLRTLKMLVLKPGFLSREFNAGKRADYVMPVRVYVMISFIFFFLLNILSSNHQGETGQKQNINHGRNKSNLSMNYRGIYSSELIGLNKQQADSLIKAKGIENTGANRYVIYQMHKIVNSSQSEFWHLFMKNTSYMMFVLMPVFGLFILFFNRKFVTYYIEGLIISIHFHSFVFILFSVLLLFSYFLSMEIFFLLGTIIAPFYMFFMFKNIFGQSNGKTLLKTFFIGLLYLCALFVLMFATIVVSILII